MSQDSQKGKVCCRSLEKQKKVPVVFKITPDLGGGGESGTGSMPLGGDEGGSGKGMPQYIAGKRSF